MELKKIVEFFIAIVAMPLLLIACSQPQGPGFSFHNPKLPDNPMRHLDYLGFFEGGYIWIKEGILQPDGSFLVKGSFDKVASFKHFFAVAVGEKVNLVKRDGTFVFTDDLRELLPFKNGYGIAKGYPDTDNPRHYLKALFDDKGKILGNMWFLDARLVQDGVAFVETEEGMYFVDTEGNYLNAHPLPYDEISDFSEGTAVARTGKKSFFVDKQFHPISTHSFFNARPFSDGVAAVSVKSHDGSESWYFIDRDFKKIGNLIFDEAYSFENGIARVKDSSGWYFIDKGENTLGDIKFDRIGAYKYGYAIVKKDNLYNIFTTEGKLISDIWYDSINSIDTSFVPLPGFKYLVSKNRVSNFLDNEMNLLLPDDWFLWVYLENKLLNFTFQRDQNYPHDELVTTLGGQPVLPYRVRTPYSPAYGLMPVERADGKQNFIDVYSTHGDLLCDEWFDTISPLYHGSECAIVSKGEYSNLMFSDGSLFLDPWSSHINSLWIEGNRAYAVQLEDGYLLVDRECHPIAETHYEKIDTSKPHTVLVKKDGFWFLLDENFHIERPVFYHQYR